MPLQRFKHQLEIFEQTRDLEYFAFLWEMRVGKNLPIIDTATHLYNLNKIDTVVILAPSGVHTNWTRKVIPPERPSHDMILEWDSAGATRVAFQKKCRDYLTEPGRLLWISANAEALMTDSFQSLLALVAKRNAMRVCDESDIFKNAAAKRTKYAINTTKNYRYRRILTGTSAPQSPFDLWSQYAMLDKSIIGQDKYTTFKQRYGIFKRVRYGGPAFDKLESYRDLGDLTSRIMKHSSRLVQSDVYENLPDLIVETRTFIMSKEQQRAYDSMRDDMLLQINEGLILTATQAIVVMLRLQQISRGFITQGENVYPIDGPNPAIESLLGALKNIEGKKIIWCNNTEDVNGIMLALEKEGHSPCRYDGMVSKEQRYANLQAFLNDPKCQELVGTPATGGVGLDVSVADTTIFYSHSYKLRERLQAIARNQGPNQKAAKLLLVSIVGQGTGDAKCIARLEEKRLTMKALMGDDLGFEDVGDKESAMDILKQFLSGE